MREHKKVGKRKKVEKKEIPREIAIKPMDRKIISFYKRIKGINSLGNGKIAVVDRAVREFADRFSGSNLNYAGKIANAISKFKKITLKKNQIEQYYAKRSASEIIKSRIIYLLDKPIKKGRNIFRVEGCLERSNAVAALLRARQIPAYFVRIGTHSFVIARINIDNVERFYRIDILEKANDIVEPISISDIAIMESVISTGGGRIGIDSGDIGIRSLADTESAM